MIHVILIGEMLHMMSQRQIQCNGNDTTFKTNFYNIVYSIAQPNRYFLHKLNDSNDKVQIKITSAGVNAHHQNGVAERRIRELQDMARTMLIHANSRWPESVTTNLWPYAIRMASEAINNTPNFKDNDRKTPWE
jgi:hypothetical protein